MRVFLIPFLNFLVIGCKIVIVCLCFFIQFSCRQLPNNLSIFSIPFFLIFFICVFFFHFIFQLTWYWLLICVCLIPFYSFNFLGLCFFRQCQIMCVCCLNAVADVHVGEAVYPRHLVGHHRRHTSYVDVITFWTGYTGHSVCDEQQWIMFTIRVGSGFAVKNHGWMSGSKIFLKSVAFV